MAKEAGLGDRFFVAGYDLSGDTASIDTIGGGPEALDITGIDKTAMERVGGLRSGGMSWTSWFDDAALAEHAALSTLPTTDVICTYFRGTTVGNAAASVTAKQINYDPTRSPDGVFQFNVDVESNAFGLEWGQMLTAGLRSDTTATSPSTGADGAAATDLGLQAYLQVISFTGTDITFDIEDSADNSSFANMTGTGFTQVTSAPTFERIASATNENVKRYLRLASVGTFSECTFAVMVVRNATLPVF